MQIIQEESVVKTTLISKNHPQKRWNQNITNWIRCEEKIIQFSILFRKFSIRYEIYFLQSEYRN